MSSWADRCCWTGGRRRWRCAGPRQAARRPPRLLPRVTRGFGALAGELLAAPGEHEKAAALVEAVDVLLGLLYVLVDLIEALLHAVELLCTRTRTPALISILHITCPALSYYICTTIINSYEYCSTSPVRYNYEIQ